MTYPPVPEPPGTIKVNLWKLADWAVFFLLLAAAVYVAWGGEWPGLLSFGGYDHALILDKSEDSTSEEGELILKVLPALQDGGLDAVVLDPDQKDETGQFPAEWQPYKDYVGDVELPALVLGNGDRPSKVVHLPDSLADVKKEAGL